MAVQPQSASYSVDTGFFFSGLSVKFATNCYLVPRLGMSVTTLYFSFMLLSGQQREHYVLSTNMVWNVYFDESHWLSIQNGDRQTYIYLIFLSKNSKKWHAAWMKEIVFSWWQYFALRHNRLICDFLWSSFSRGQNVFLFSKVCVQFASTYIFTEEAVWVFPRSTR
jgi:hypothetical protein